MTTRSDTINAIRRLNTTASPEFLTEFSDDQLSRYLARLDTVSRARPLCWDDDALVRDEALSNDSAKAPMAPG